MASLGSSFNARQLFWGKLTGGVMPQLVSSSALRDSAKIGFFL